MATETHGEDRPEGEFTRGDLARERVRAALARGDTYAQAARAGGVHERTVARWMTQPAFALSVSDARREQVSVVSGRLSDAASEAVDVLLAAMRSDNLPVSTRAAQLVLAWQAKSRRGGELEDRIMALEARDGFRPPVPDEVDDDEAVER